MTDRPDTFVGLDMAGALARCLVGVRQPAGLTYLACGSMPSLRWDAEGQRHSELTGEALREVVCEVERAAGLTVFSAVVGTCGQRVESQLVRSGIDLGSEPRAVTMDDIRLVLEKAEGGVRGTSSTVLQLIPLEFVAGDRAGLVNPLGMTTSQLETYVRVIETDRQSFGEVNAAVKRAGLRVEECILGGFAAAYATLEERDLAEGVANLDFGGFSAGLTAYVGRTLRLAVGLPIGRNDLVRDVMTTFGTDASVASSLISQLGRVEYDTAKQFSSIFVPGPDPTDPVGSGGLRSWSLLIKVITRRVDDCFQHLRSEFRRAQLGKADVRTLVLTGDLAGLPGIARAAMMATGLRTRVGVPKGLLDLPAELRSPAWASAVGLVLYANRLAGDGPAGTTSADFEENAVTLREQVQ